MSKFSKFLDVAKSELDEHSPEILTGLGIAGMFASVIFSIKATSKAVRAIDEKKKELNKEKLCAKETVQTVWKYYIPTAITFAAGAACIIGSDAVHSKRSATIAAAYSISETALTEYKDKVREVIGENKESDVQAELARDKVVANPPSQGTIIITGKGDTLFMEAVTGQYFRSDIEKVRRVENDLNREMRSSMTISLNDVLCSFGIRHNHKMYDHLGWDIDKHPIEFVMTPIIDDDIGVVIVIDYRYEPTDIV